MSCVKRRDRSLGGTFSPVRGDRRGPAETRYGLPDPLEAWVKATGRTIADEAVAKRSIRWITPEKLAVYLAFDLQEQGRSGLEPIEELDGVARRRCGTVLADIGRGLPRRSRAKAARGERHVSDLGQMVVASVQPDEPFDAALATRAILREEYEEWDAARDAARPIATPSRPVGPPAAEVHWDTDIEGSADADEMRRSIASWLTKATRGGHRDARFGDPALQAAVLLHLLTFFEHPLVDHRFWPHGFPPADDSEATDDLHARVALWLADREWFPAEPEGDTQRRRARRAREAVEALARSLRDEMSAER